MNAAQILVSMVRLARTKSMVIPVPVLKGIAEMIVEQVLY